MDNMKVTVLGMGYIGLPTAALIASRGFKVHGVDVNEDVVNSINRRKDHTNEPGLDKLIEDVVDNCLLTASTTVSPADVYIIAVPTPTNINLEPDLSYIKSAASMISPHLKRGDLIILESTSPVGTTEKMADWLSIDRKDLKFPKDNSDNDFDVFMAFCPERVLPGRALVELSENHRIIGGITLESGLIAENFYKTFIKGSTTITKVRVAELAKLAENSFRDVNIAFANELSLICDKFDVDVWSLIQLANKHPRVNILNPGPGVGGHCIAVDPLFIVHGAPELSNLIKAARTVNDSKPKWVVNKTKQAIQSLLKTGGKSEDIKISCLGLSFKPNVNDLRESPALAIANLLASETDCNICAVEPNIDNFPCGLNGSIKIETLNKALDTSDIVLLLVAHTEFEKIEASSLEQKILIDTCGLIEKRLMWDES